MKEIKGESMELIAHLNARIAARNADEVLSMLTCILDEKKIRLFGEHPRYVLSNMTDVSSPPIKWRELCNLVVQLGPAGIVPVAAGVPMLFPPRNWAKVLANVDDYDVYEIALGTVLMLYFDGFEWRLGSKRSIDIRSKHWRDQSISFENAFYEALGDYQVFDYLDKNKTYSFVVHNSKIHVFDNSPETPTLLHVCTRDNRTLKILDDDIGVPRQRPIDITVEEMLRGLNMPILEQDMQKPILGYILRAKRDTAEPHVIMKSKLYKKIEFYIGNEPNTANIVRAVSTQPEEDIAEFRHMFPALCEPLQQCCQRYTEIARKIANPHNHEFDELRNIIQRSAMGNAFESKNVEKILYDILRTSKEANIIKRMKLLV